MVLAAIDGTNPELDQLRSHKWQCDGLGAAEQTLPAVTFLSNSGAHVTATGAAFIAGRLRQAIDKDVVSELMSFYDDAPDSDDVTKWVKEFADFSERAVSGARNSTKSLL